MEVMRVQRIHVLFMLLVATVRSQVNPGIVHVCLNTRAVHPQEPLEGPSAHVETLI